MLRLFLLATILLMGFASMALAAPFERRADGVDSVGVSFSWDFVGEMRISVAGSVAELPFAIPGSDPHVVLEIHGPNISFLKRIRPPRGEAYAFDEVILGNTLARKGKWQVKARWSGAPQGSPLSLWVEGYPTSSKVVSGDHSF